MAEGLLHFRFAEAGLAITVDSVGTGIQRFLEYAMDRPADVPDPHYGGADQFQILFDTPDQAVGRLISRYQAASG